MFLDEASRLNSARRGSTTIETITQSQETTAVVLFTGNVRREEQRKGLPPRLLAATREGLLDALRGVAACDVYVCGDDIPGFAAGRIDSSAPLPELVARTVDKLFARYQRVVLLAGDVCGLTRRHLEEALQHLDTDRAAVVGPACDGGFYLAAFNQAPHLDWASLSWFQHTIGTELVTGLADDGFVVSLLDPLADIDSVGDAQRIAQAYAHSQQRLRSILTAALAAALRLRTYRPSLRPPLDVAPASLRRPPPALAS
jgi:2-phospho-L-lactate guanylyltransferase (CobY/MobA/RfbA family)